MDRLFRLAGVTGLIVTCLVGVVATVEPSGAAAAAGATRPLVASAASALSCPTASVCTAVGGPVDAAGATILRTTNGGATWRPQQPPAGVLGLSAISCPKVEFCLATGGPFGESTEFVTATTSDGGATWHKQPGIGVDTWIDTVDCLSSTNCFAEGFGSGWAKGSSGLAVLHTTDAGASWSLLGLPAGGKSASSTTRAVLACPTAIRCYLARPIGNGSTFDLFASSDAGKTGRAVLVRERGLANTPVGVACWAATSCMVVGADRGSRALVTTDGGARWLSRPLPKGAVDGVGVQCPSRLRCVVVATTHSGLLAATTTNAGATWSTSAVAAFWPVSADAFVGLECPTAGSCHMLVQTSTPAVYSTSNGGEQWTKRPLT